MTVTVINAVDAITRCLKKKKNKKKNNQVPEEEEQKEEEEEEAEEEEAFHMLQPANRFNRMCHLGATCIKR